MNKIYNIKKHFNMKKSSLILCSLFAFIFAVQAQYSVVVFNYEKSNFNDGQPLPAETKFNVKGDISPDIEAVEFSIFKAKDNDRSNPLAVADWKKPMTSTKQSFELPVNYKLRGGNEYDVMIRYYRPLNESERSYLQKSVRETVDAYINQSVEINRNKITLLRPPRQIIADLNTIVSEGLSIYKNRNELVFDGFSDVIKTKLDQLDNISLRKGKFQFENVKKSEGRVLLANKLIADLQSLTQAELQQYLNTELLIVSDTKVVNDYPTENTNSELAVNIGWGSVVTEPQFDNLNYADGPFVGLSFPLGNSAFASEFWSRTAITAGFFIRDLEDQDDQEIRGIIFDRPAYLGLGYKILDFLRLNAGAAVTKNVDVNAVTLEETEELKIRPFVGISAEINLWLGLGNRR